MNNCGSRPIGYRGLFYVFAAISAITPMVILTRPLKFTSVQVVATILVGLAPTLAFIIAGRIFGSDLRIPRSAILGWKVAIILSVILGYVVGVDFTCLISCMATSYVLFHTVFEESSGSSQRESVSIENLGSQ